MRMGAWACVGTSVLAWTFGPGAGGALAQQSEAPPQQQGAPAQKPAEATLPEIVVKSPAEAKPAPKAKAKSAGKSKSGGAVAADSNAQSAPPSDLNTNPPETATGPVKGFVATRSAAGTKTDTPILETPQSISVVTSDQMRTRAVKTVNEALEYTPGIYTHPGGKDPRYDQFTIRGFSAQGNGTFRDGLKELGSADNFNHFRSEPYGIERIDVLRGPATVLYGQTAPGGIIDIITKRPTAETQREFVGTIGSDERFQGAFDLSGAVDQDGTLLFRLVGLAHDADAQVAHFSDFVEDDRLFIAPSFTWRPSADTTLTILTDFQHDLTGNAFPLSHVLFGSAGISDVVALPLFLGDPSFNKFEQDQFRLGYQFEHRFNDTFTVRQNLRYGEVDLDYRYLTGFLAGAATTAARVSRLIDENTESFTIDNQLQAKLSSGPITHTILTGLDHQHFGLDHLFLGGSAPSLNINDPVYGQTIATPTTPLASTDQKASQLGVYAQDQVKLDHWVLTLGGRYDWANVDTLDRLETDSTKARTVKDDEAFSGRAGLTYMFDMGLAPYVSYSESFLPTTGTNFDGNPFDPTTGQQYEAGLKFEPIGSKARLTLAVFDLTQQNVLTADTAPGHTGFSVQTGEIRSRGFEAEAVASLTRELDLIATYTSMDVEVTKSNTAAEVGKVPILTPEELASVFADYTIQSGPLAGFGFGAGVRYVGSSYMDTANLISNDAYTIADAVVHYTFDGTTLALNVSNLFDKEQATCSTSGGCQWNSPHIVTATVRHRW